MKNFFSTIGFVFFAILVYALLTSGSRNTENNANTLNQYITQPYVPPQIHFAGEAVPLHQYDVRERLDREITNLSYRHSGTLHVLKMSNRWFPTIERILRANNIPEDFKYLAVAESALENVVSPAKARGFWQFMHETAKSFGLEVSSDVDERYHVEKATVAACKYFKKAHAKFGSWAMVAASYNMGMGGVNKQATNQQTYNYYDLYLNRETSKYMFRILSYKIMMENPTQYGFHLNSSDLYQEVPHRTIMVKSISDIATFARQNGTTYKRIKLLNPWLRKTSLKAKGGKSYAIKLPA